MALPVAKRITPTETKPAGNPIETTTQYQTETKLQHKTMIDGTPWVGTALFQLLGADDAPKQLDPSLSPSLQQYLMVRNYQFMIQGEASSSIDQATGIVTYSGEVHMWPGNEPNWGDHFIARLPDGRMGLFILEDPQPLTIYSYTAYSASFKLFNVLTEELQKDIERKIVQVISFDASMAGCPGALGPDDETLQDMARLLSHLLGRYYDEFYDLQTRTFLKPDSLGVKIYDGMIVDFMREITDRKLRGSRPMPQAYETPQSNYIRETRTVYDALVEHEPYYLETVSRHYREVGTKGFYSPYVNNSIHMTHIDRVILPDDEGTLWAPESEQTSTLLYGFSEEFYDQDMEHVPNVIEKYILMALNEETVLFKDLLEYSKTLKDQTSVERFYRIPALIWLVRRVMMEKPNSV